MTQRAPDERMWSQQQIALGEGGDGGRCETEIQRIMLQLFKHPTEKHHEGRFTWTKWA